MAAIVFPGLFMRDLIRCEDFRSTFIYAIPLYVTNNILSLVAKGVWPTDVFSSHILYSKYKSMFKGEKIYFFKKTHIFAFSGKTRSQAKPGPIFSQGSLYRELRIHGPDGSLVIATSFILSVSRLFVIEEYLSKKLNLLKNEGVRAYSFLTFDFLNPLKIPAWKKMCMGVCPFTKGCGYFYRWGN